MTRSLYVLVCVATLAGAASAQVPTGQTKDAASSSPIAYVYVSKLTHVQGYAASSDGKLTPLPGSPYANIAVSHMSVNKKFLFGTGDDGTNLYSYSIAPDGALKQVAVTNAQTYNANRCGGLGPTQIDGTGSTLYTQVNGACAAGGTSYEIFKIEDTGNLQYLGSSEQLMALVSPLHFLGNNNYAVEVDCFYPFGDGPLPFTAIYNRESNGLLNYVNYDNQSPAAENPDDSYCASVVAPDPTNHLAYAYRDFDNDSQQYVGPAVLATYSIDSQGNITTNSTYENMPATDLPSVSAMSISPSGELLAVGGPGFQLFHYNGSNPITPYTGLLQANDNFEEFGWDSANHLYALSSGALRVYTATPTSLQEISGSPYLIPDATSLIVLPLK